MSMAGGIFLWAGASPSASGVREPFSTRISNSRRTVSAKWLAAFAPAPVASAAVIIGSRVPSPKKRVNVTHRRKVVAPQPAASPLVASNARGVGEQFRTYLQRSRRVQTIGWLAALAPIVVATVPVAAWLVKAAPVVRRKVTKHKIVVLPALQWQYIAPTVAAILPRAKVFKIDFKRKVQKDSPLLLSAPPTGPPALSAYAVFKVRKFSHNKRLVRVPDQAAYPATLVPANPAGNADAAFVTNKARGRRVLSIGWTAALATTTPAVLPQAPWLPAAKATRRVKFKRRLAPATVQLLFPATPTQAVTFAAVATKAVKRRRSRAALFLSAGASTLSLAPTATPVVYPSFVPPQALVSWFDRRLLRAAPQPLFPATPVVTITDRALGEPFTTRLGRSRKIQAVAVSSLFPATPAPAAQPIAAVVANKVKRRKSRAGLFLSGIAVDGFAAVAVVQPESAWRRPATRRVKFKRRPLPASAQLLFLATPPVAAQPETALRLAKVFRVSQRRKLLPADVLLEYPATPFVPPSSSGGATGGGGWNTYGKPKSDGEKRRENKKLEDDIRRIYRRLMNASPEVVEAVEEIVEPITKAPPKKVSKAVEIDYRAAQLTLDKLSADVELALRLAEKELETKRAQRAENMRRIALILELVI